MKGVLAIALLCVSNIFMTFAWYGHLKFKEYSWFSKLGLFAIILISWGIAFLNMWLKFQPIKLVMRATEALLTFGN